MNQVTADNFYYRYAKSEPHTSGGRAHTHSLLELIYVVRGDVLYAVEDRVYKLSRGDLVIVQPGTYHDIRFESDREYERCNIRFDPKAFGLSRAQEVSERFEVISLSAHPEIAAIFTKMEEYRASLPYEEFAEAVIHLLFALFFDLSLCDLAARRDPKLHPMLSEALAYIGENLFKIRSVAEVAAELHVTESSLFRLFRQELNTSPKRYIADKRLLAADDMLRRGHRPTEVYSVCGFSDYTTFFRNYKRFFGVSPSHG